MKERRLLLYVILVMMLTLIPVVAIHHILLPHFLWHNEALHSTVEAVGALSAIIMALVLLQREPEGGGRLFWVAMGLLGAGILDGFHAVSQPGQGFVLLHSMAVLIGGFGFALVWLPESDRYACMRKRILWAVITGSTLFGIWTFSFPGTLPIMVEDGEFTTAARALNLLSGVFYIVAAGRFVLDFHRSVKLESYLFACMAVLFGLASLMFTYSALWDDAWWFWHLVRLSAYLVVMWFVVREYLHTVLSLRGEITERKLAEERTAHLTAVLRALRDVNQLITREKGRESLIQKSCDLLVQRKGYEGAWILSLDENRNFVTVSSSGLGENASTFLKQLETGNYPVCVRELLAQEQAFISYDQPGKQHQGCVLAGQHSRQGVFRCKLEYVGKLYGVLGVALHSGAVSDKEEQGLFLELCGDFAFALANIEREEKREQAEEQIEQAAREWQTTFDSISEWVSVHDKDFKITRVNKAFADFVKMKPGEIIGRHCYELIHGEREPSQSCPHKEALETGVPTYREFFNPHLGIYMEVVCSPIFNERGEITSTVHIGRDITEHKKMEAQLMVTDRLASVGELASGIAHELSNPLTGIIGFSDLLLERDLPDDVKEDLKTINKEAQRTAQIVRNLLTFARKHPQEKQPVNINNAIQSVLELRAYEQRVSNIQVSTYLAADLPKVMADGFQLQQVFLNLIINAEYFMIEAHRGGTLTITTERVGDIIQVSLADDGPGIARENLGHIFDPFFTTKEVGKGTGLGLSICHGIVTGHGGRIYAESEPGKGATFIVELPISP